ncbi:unnamed protein product, partial [Mesorhabditis belari]|uniref:Uncharacterized protein n=1 Tax=Mesorhabditis belari TaxID=2138241 RepID=A0AAF3EHA7_9BILA
MEPFVNSLKIGFIITSSSICTLLIVYVYHELTEPCKEEFAFPNYRRVSNLRQDSPCSYLKIPNTLDTMLSSWQDFISALSYINKEKLLKILPRNHSDLGVAKTRSISILPTKLKDVGNQVASTVRVLQIGAQDSRSSIRLLETAKSFVKDKSIHLIPISTWMTPTYVKNENGSWERADIEDLYPDYLNDLQTHELLDNVFPMRLPFDKAAEILECSGVSFHILYITPDNMADIVFALNRFLIFVEEGGYVIGEMRTNASNWKDTYDRIQQVSTTQKSLENDGEYWAIKIRRQLFKR